jgi:hypothetical protein
MRIHCIFEEINGLLYVVAYAKSKSILKSLEAKWTDTAWLFDFFESNKDDLHSGFWGSISVDKAIEQTVEDAHLLHYKLRHATSDEIKDMFVPLHDEILGGKEFQELKARGFIIKKSWLRIYAILWNNKYYITGGAIKLTRAMPGRAHTEKELATIKMVKNRLKMDNIDDLIVYLDN